MWSIRRAILLDFPIADRACFAKASPVEEVAEQVGTPAYLYSRASIEQAYRRMDSAFGSLPHTICYAVKANSNLGILRVFAALGSGFDIVSGGELYRLRRIGVPGNRIVFSGVGKSREEIREALRARILLFNVESPAELDLLASEASRLRVRAAASIRVNPDVEAGGHPHISTGHHRHKFGIDWDAARSLYLEHRDSRWIEWQGISAHIGSQILTLAPYRRALARLAGFVRDLGARGHLAPLSRLRRRARHSLHGGAAAGEGRVRRGAGARRSPARLPPADRAGAFADRSGRACF